MDEGAGAGRQEPQPVAGRDAEMLAIALPDAVGVMGEQAVQL